jgi:riboflavin synthase alpha subunit
VAVFTGIVRERGRVVGFDNGRLEVEMSVGAGVGDPVAVDRACLVERLVSRTRLTGYDQSNGHRREPALPGGEAG